MIQCKKGQLFCIVCNKYVSYSFNLAALSEKLMLCLFHLITAALLCQSCPLLFQQLQLSIKEKQTGKKQIRRETVAVKRDLRVSVDVIKGKSAGRCAH